MLERYDAPFPIDQLNIGSLEIATTLLALCAYPERKNLKQNGPAHRFKTAQLSWLVRRAKGMKKIERLPFWCLERQQESNVLRSGFRRLAYLRSSHLLMCEILMQKSSLKAINQYGSGLIVNFSGDFERCEIIISNDMQSLNSTISSMPNSVEAFIRKHTSAFGHNDPNPDLVRDIRRRYLYKYLSISHIFTVIHGECINQYKDSLYRKWSPLLMLISNPDWAETAVKRIITIQSISLFYAQILALRSFTDQNILQLVEVPHDA